MRRRLIFLLVLAAGLAVYSFWQDGKMRLEAVTNYVAAKQELTSRFKEFRLDPGLFFWLRWYPAGQDVRESFTVNGVVSTVTLDVVLRRENGVWQVRAATLRGASMADVPLSAVRVTGVKFYAASTSSAPLKKPEYAEGEDVHVVVELGGLSALATGSAIKESIKVFDQDNTLVAELKDVAKSVKAVSTETMRFSSLIESLVAGRYSIQFVFADAQGQELDSSWQEIAIKKISQEIIVKAVRYYEDAARVKRKNEAEFTTRDMIYFSIVASGFRVSDAKLAGTVDLKITDARDQVIVNTPGFVKFNQKYVHGHDVVVNGQIQLKEPGVYFFEFVLNDYFTKRQLTQTEKITVLQPSSK